MASAEQPLKKRKLYESASEPQNLQECSVSSLSQEEIMRKKHNKEEIKSLYECYRRIRFCISHKDARFMPDFEQAYLSLITASRGCTSVQRIVAELIPRYASYCPTALEAAAKVAINMYNWSLAVILRGESDDVLAFQTAKACVFGLVDICCTASSEAPTSSVIRGICSAVFLNALTFFINSFEGKNVYQIGDEEIAKVQDSLEQFSELKEKVADEDDSTLVRLFKLRAVSLLRIFFCCPKNLLAACLELFKSSGTDSGALKGGSYFLRQVTSEIKAADVTHRLEKISDEARSSTGSIEENTGGIAISEERLASNGNRNSEDASLVAKNCLLGMVLNKDPSLRDWIFSKYNKIRKSMCSEAASEVSSALEGIFGSFSELAKEVVGQDDSDDDNSSPAKHINRQYLMPVISNQRESSVDQFGRDSRVHDAYMTDAFNDDRDSADKVSGQPVKSCNSAVPFEPGIEPVHDNSKYKCDGITSMKDLETREGEDSCRDRPSMQINLVNRELPSPVNRKPLDFRSDALESINHIAQVDNQHSKSDFGLPPTRSTFGGAAHISPSPEQHSAVRNHSSSTSHYGWYFDGDPASMDVIAASNQLWLGSLGPDASESLVRFQFEKFGPMERFLFYPLKDFALVEYRHIMDAMKAREYMRGSSPWGTSLRIKFLDIGLGSRGSINGVAVGASCLVYIGNVSSQWAKDEILHELGRVGFRTPRMVTDLTSECALLMELETPEEAAVVMAHLRQYRKESGFHGQMNKNVVLNAVTTDVTGSQLDARFVPTPIRVDFRSNNTGSMPNNMVGSPYVSTVHNSPIDNSKTRISQLSSLLSSLSSKYNINQSSSSSCGGHLSRNYNATAVRDEDTFPTSTLWISLADSTSQFLTDDELMSVCHLAAGNFGSVVRLTRTNLQMGSCWFVELSSVDAAVTAFKNLRSCPVSFFQIEFSQPGGHNSTPFISKSESTAQELVSPSIQLDNRGTTVQSGHPFQSNWTGSGYTEVLDVGTRTFENIGGYDNNLAADFSHPVSEVHAGSHGNEQVWMYKKPETGSQFSGAGILPCPPIATQGATIMPPQQVQASPFMRPVYHAPSNSWDARGLIQPLPLNHVSSGTMANNLHVNVPPPPFLPASVTPLSQISGNSMPHFDVVMPAVPPLSSPPPPPPDVPPPIPPSPPPLPVSQPPLVPPPPSSPPPLQPSAEASNLDNAVHCLQYQWQGVLCKSGVHYCTIYALREDLDACKYSYGVSEPAEWPARLDMTKRTDFQHVKSTFNSTPPHKREICRLLPSTTSDHKGFQDFVTYLKQRECAGVIKIPAIKTMWSRLLFILPYSSDACSMLGIAPHPSECLIALVLPKETSFEWV